MKSKRPSRAAFWRRAVCIIPALAGILLCVMSLSAPAHAQKKENGLFSGEYLMQLCASDMKGREIIPGGHTACQAYISGVVDYHNMLRSLDVQPVVDICVPNTASPKRLQDIVWVYLAKHKEHTPFIASPAVALALYDYYPCKEFRTKKRYKR